MLSQSIEKTKSDFSVDALLDARTKTLEAMNRMAQSIHVGILEEDALKKANQILKDMGCEKSWHRVYVRFGKNTLKGYGEPSEPGTRLQENDIFFLDIGPVFGEYEGDAGATYVVGNDLEMARCARDSQRLFEIVRDHWKKTGCTGDALYAFASVEAEKLGWNLNLKVAGHRIADFPHAIYSKMNLAKYDKPPTPHLWVLEIQIRHPTRDFGAFYEDLLF